MRKVYNYPIQIQNHYYPGGTCLFINCFINISSAVLYDVNAEQGYCSPLNQNSHYYTLRYFQPHPKMHVLLLITGTPQLLMPGGGIYQG